MDRDLTFVSIRYKLNMILVKRCHACAVEQVGQVGNIDTDVEHVHDLCVDALHFRR